jgi:polysaccharide biosynthesis/export protein
MKAMKSNSKGWNTLVLCGALMLPGWAQSSEQKPAEKPAAQAEAKPPAEKSGEKSADATKPGEKPAARAAAATPAITSKPAPAVDPDYVIGIEDVLAVNVWREQEMSRVVTVRPDGKITLPLLGEFEADGQTPKKLETAILAKLSTLVTNPEVSVIVQEIRSQKFNIVGEVQKPGTYPIAGTTTVLDAIAMAGGFKEFARPKKMYILRKHRDGGTVKISVNYDKVIKGETPEQNMKLETKDTLVVP